MRVFIAEKPSLAAAIFKGLGGDVNKEKKDGYYQRGSDVVTWSLGHLLALYDPEDYHAEHKKWTLDSLPLNTVYPPKMKPIAKSKKQLNVVLEWIKKADSIVHAGDPDPEGCLLIDEILAYANNTKPVQRVLIADLNDKPVKAALASLQPNEKFQPLTQKALARAIADQTFGYNLTRAYTLKAREKGFDSVLNIGRVITAMLGMINERTLANQGHKASFYYELFGQFEMAGRSIKAKLIPDESFELDDKGRITSSIEAAATKEVDTGAKALITGIEQKSEKRQPPMPFNLSKLQIEASKRWGYKPKEVLDTIQGLYEKHKLLTYPRSDNQYLSEAHLDNTQSIFSAIQGTMPHLAPSIGEAAPSSTHKAFNASKIEAHHAIVPTEKSGEGITLSERERNLYELVAKRFIALFHPESERSKVALDIECTQRLYRATQTTLVKQGWEVLFKGEAREETNHNDLDLLAFHEGEQGHCEQVTMEQRETKPPKYFDDASLLKAMTQAAKFIKDEGLRKTLEAKDKETAGENGSIGTEATRSGHIEKIGKLTHLVSVTKEKGYKNPVYKTTEAGQEFCALLPEEVVRPDISAIWERSFEKIAHQELRITEFLSSVDEYLESRIDHVKAHGVPFSKRQGVTCPTCQQGTLIKRQGRNGAFWSCNRYPDCKTTFPDDNGEPNLKPKPKQTGALSSEEFCKECGSPLVRREGKKKGTFWWGCSGFPKCKVRYFDKNGKPDRDHGPLS